MLYKVLDLSMAVIGSSSGRAKPYYYPVIILTVAMLNLSEKIA